MGVSQRRREQRAKRAAKKEARMKSPGMDSRYARKVRGDYPPNSPYRTGNWGQAMRKLHESLRGNTEQRSDVVSGPGVGFEVPEGTPSRALIDQRGRAAVIAEKGEKQ